MDEKAQQATNFSLNNYFTDQKNSLEDYIGKAILLTYWFPGCGPCRAEFPHFQNIVDQFSNEELAYLGINIESIQNDYVIPFLENSGYSFIPLEDFKSRDKGNMGNFGAPVNYLLDCKGRIIYSKFRTDNSSEDVLKNMISIILKNG